MKTEPATRWAARLLVWFVLVSIGFATGRDVTMRRLRSAQTTPAESATPTAAGEQLLAYYMHGTFRCVTCNELEKAAQAVLRGDFEQELASGRIIWKEVDFDAQPVLAKKYDVSASTLVLVRMRDGKEVSFRRLDDTWPLAEKPAELKAYILKHVREMMP